MKNLRNSQIVILGAGSPYKGEEPSALTPLMGGQRVLDWIIDAFSVLDDPEFHYIGGYGIQKIIDLYPEINFEINPRWKTTGSVGSLLKAPLVEGNALFITYSDIVFRRSVVEELNASEVDITIVVDREWKTRYKSRTYKDLESAEKVILSHDDVVSISPAIAIDEASGEFAGLVKFSGNAVAELKNMFSRDYELFMRMTVPELIMHLRAKKFKVRALRIDGDWAELNAPQDLAKFVLGTKAATLRRLKRLVSKCVVDDQYSFTLKEWTEEQLKVLSDIDREFNNRILVVRSSAITEDSWSVSGAGQFTSLLNISQGNQQELIAAISEVIASYGDTDPAHQVLIQEMVQDVTVSGVVFTRTLNHGAPYYVINYDDVSSSTESVTSGSGKKIKTCYLFKGWKKEGIYLDNHQLERTISAVEELEELVGYDCLDIEFAITRDGVIHILQLRPITVEHEYAGALDTEIYDTIRLSAADFTARQTPSPFLKGKRTFYGVMPDWNPAEIIGTKPTVLTYSLYRYLVTDEIWARQRAEYGYRDVQPCPLMYKFCGHPYIDVRASFNSFIPGDIDDRLTEKLIECYLNILQSNPQLHDKIEFDIVFSCLTFDYDKVARERMGGHLDDKEIGLLKAALKEITKQAISRGKRDLEKIGILSDRYDRIIGSDIECLDKAFILLDDVKRFGTLPFAHLARSAFVAVTLLRSLEKRGVLGKYGAAGFINSLSTVTRQFEHDGKAVMKGNMDWSDFVSKYGHLRPGTYSLVSDKYADDPEKYLKPMLKSAKSDDMSEETNILFDDKTRLNITEELVTAGLPMNFDDFHDFLKQSIEGREYAKFMFTRNLSAALDELIGYASHMGLSRNDIENISINDLSEIRNGGGWVDLKKYLGMKIAENKKQYQLAQSIELPPLITSVTDFYYFHLPECHPNFVTQKRVIAEVVKRLDCDGLVDQLRGKIVLIDKADPGFDWLFGYEIGGLITMYGGSNSHMTIRAAEIGLPAAIGVGESFYDNLLNAEVIDMDCAARTMKIIR